MSNLLYAGMFAIFVALAAVVRLSRGDRRAIAALIAYVVAVHALLLLFRRDAWPFVTHGAFFETSDSRRPFSTVEFAGVDAAGKEHRIDPRAWRPITDRTLAVWWLVDFRRLSLSDQRTAMAFLLGKAERWRRSSDPLQLLRAPAWYSIESPPPRPDSPYVALRTYLVTRIPATGAAHSALLSEYRQ